MKRIKSVLMITMVAGGMFYGGWTLISPTKAFATGTCCATSADCPGAGNLCNAPGPLGLMDCSTDKKGYCDIQIISLE